MLGDRDIQNIMAGGRHESQIEGLNEEIQSKNIVSFSYTGTDFYVGAKREKNKVKIICNGGGKYNRRDGSLFSIVYETEDDSIFPLLQQVIDENHETRGNGHCVHVDGLPGGIGDRLEVEYESGEKIYKSSNQFQTVMFESSKKFYELFHEFVLKEGYDFTTAGSNVKLFDDADYEYLQGTWKGTSFGREIVVTFTGNKVTITVDETITDENVEYTIFQGSVVSNQLIEGKEKAESYHDYELFKGVSTFSKKNWFTMTGYHLGDSYSSFDLHNFDKKKEEE